MKALRSTALFLTALTFPALGAECDAQWKEMRASLLAFKELHFKGTVPQMPGVIEMNVVEKPVDRGADMLDVSTTTEIKGIPMKIPGGGAHTSSFTRKKFCADLAKKDDELTIDGQSPGVMMAQIFRGESSKTESVTTPAGTFQANVYEMKVKSKKAGAELTKVRMWVTKVQGHRMPIRTIVESPESPVVFDVQLAKAVAK